MYGPLNVKKKKVSFTAVIYTKVALLRQLCVNNPLTEFQRSLSKGSMSIRLSGFR
jgi:hypothetical protein